MFSNAVCSAKGLNVSCSPMQSAQLWMCHVLQCVMFCNAVCSAKGLNVSCSATQSAQRKVWMCHVLQCSLLSERCPLQSPLLPCRLPASLPPNPVVNTPTRPPPAPTNAQLSIHPPQPRKIIWTRENCSFLKLCVLSSVVGSYDECALFDTFSWDGL